MTRWSRLQCAVTPTWSSCQLCQRPVTILTVSSEGGEKINFHEPRPGGKRVTHQIEHRYKNSFINNLAYDFWERKQVGRPVIHNYWKQLLMAWQTRSNGIYYSTGRNSEKSSRMDQVVGVQARKRRSRNHQGKESNRRSNTELNVLLFKTCPRLRYDR